MVHAAFSGASIRHVWQYDGCRSPVFQIDLGAPIGTVVLRVFEHGSATCRKQIDLLALAGRVVPVPQVIYAEEHEIEGIPPFMIMKFVNGIPFDQLIFHGTLDDICQGACAVGETLAAVGRITFDTPGWLGPGARVTQPLLPAAGNLIPRMADACLAHPKVIARLGLELCDRLHAFVWTHAEELTQLDDMRRLVHYDFGKTNTLMRYRNEKWEVAAVLDWEFAISSSPLADVGHFLRYESPWPPMLEPAFSTAYTRAGGELVPDWRWLSRILDAIAIGISFIQLPPEAPATRKVALIRALVQS